MIWLKLSKTLFSKNSTILLQFCVVKLGKPFNPLKYICQKNGANVFNKPKNKEIQESSTRNLFKLELIYRKNKKKKYLKTINYYFYFWIKSFEKTRVQIFLMNNILKLEEKKANFSKILAWYDYEIIEIPLNDV